MLVPIPIRLRVFVRSPHEDLQLVPSKIIASFALKIECNRRAEIQKRNMLCK